MASNPMVKMSFIDKVVQVMTSDLESLMAYLNNIFGSDHLKNLIDIVRPIIGWKPSTERSTLISGLIEVCHKRHESIKVIVVIIAAMIDREDIWIRADETISCLGEEQSNLNEPKGETALEELKEDIDIQILVVLALNTTTEKCSKAFEFLKSLRGMGFEEKVKDFLKKLLSESLKR